MFTSWTQYIKQHYDPNGTPLFSLFTNLPNFHKSRTWSNKSQMSNLSFLIPRNQRPSFTGCFVTKAKPDKASLFSTWQQCSAWWNWNTPFQPFQTSGESGSIRIVKRSKFSPHMETWSSVSWKTETSFLNQKYIFWEDKDDQKWIWKWWHR